jgi:hypothetical protein
MKLLDFWIRREACKMTAIAMQRHREEDALCPRAWSLAVFFETYMREGAEGSQEDFGPKKPVKLEAAE